MPCITLKCQGCGEKYKHYTVRNSVSHKKYCEDCIYRHKKEYERRVKKDGNKKQSCR